MTYYAFVLPCLYPLISIHEVARTRTDAVLTSVSEHRHALARALNMVNVHAANMSSRHARDSVLGAWSSRGHDVLAKSYTRAHEIHKNASSLKLSSWCVTLPSLSIKRSNCRGTSADKNSIRPINRKNGGVVLRYRIVNGFP